MPTPVTQSVASAAPSALTTRATPAQSNSRNDDVSRSAVTRQLQTEAVKVSISPKLLDGSQGRPVVEASKKQTPPAYNSEKKSDQEPRENSTELKKLDKAA
jgi:hypothetical protein